jgi:hypothetical protein
VGAPADGLALLVQPEAWCPVFLIDRDQFDHTFEGNGGAVDVAEVGKAVLPVVGEVVDTVDALPWGCGWWPPGRWGGGTGRAAGRGYQRSPGTRLGQRG